MKKKIISCLLTIFSAAFLIVSAPSVVLGAEAAEIDSQVGIYFENNFTPKATEEIPDGQKPKEELQTTIKPVGGNVGKLLNTGELATAGISLAGLLLVGTVLMLFYYKRRKKQLTK
ncbi:LPXTG cell wall anchor domain-containing protein [Enterococcus sp. LJL99]